MFVLNAAVWGQSNNNCLRVKSSNLLFSLPNVAFRAVVPSKRSSRFQYDMVANSIAFPQASTRFEYFGCGNLFSSKFCIIHGSNANKVAFHWLTLSTGAEPSSLGTAKTFKPSNHYFQSFSF